MESSKEGGLLKFDFFRYTPVRLREQTVLGAILSLLVLFVAGSIVYNHVDKAFGDGIKSELLFENLKMTDVEVNIDIDLQTIPCELVDLRFTSKRGAAHSLQRYILDNPQDAPSLQKIQLFTHNRDMENVVEATKKKEGCKIKGEFHLHFLSNNFFVGFGNQIMMAQVMAKNPEFKLGLAHRINDLTFGPNGSLEALSKKFDLNGFNTLKNHQHLEDREDGYTGSYYHSYYLIAVPNIFDRMFGRILETFQYTASAYAKRAPNPGIVFV